MQGSPKTYITVELLIYLALLCFKFCVPLNVLNLIIQFSFSFFTLQVCIWKLNGIHAGHVTSGE